MHLKKYVAIRNSYPNFNLLHVLQGPSTWCTLPFRLLSCEVYTSLAPSLLRFPARLRDGASEKVATRGPKRYSQTLPKSQKKKKESVSASPLLLPLDVIFLSDLIYPQILFEKPILLISQ